MPERLVVIGAGMASGRMLEHLSEADPDAYDITLFNAEDRGTYNRILLSPVLAGEKTFEDIVTHDADWYAERGIATRFGERVSAIDRTQKVVRSPGGDVAYDKVVLATGSDPFMLPLPGVDLAGVISYRDIEDTRLMMAVEPGQPVVVIGGGLLGLEAAAGLAARGADVTVVHLMSHLMERQLDAEAGAMLCASLEARGITVLCDAASERILGHDGEVSGLALKDGRVLDCTLLVMAVGIRPSVGLAQDAGLAVGRAVIVDDQLRSSDPDILAIGECVEHRGTVFGLVAPLFEHAKVAADTLLGRHARYVQKSLSTKLKVTGCDLFSAGDFADEPGRESIFYRDPLAQGYKRLVLEGDRLVGAVIYGDTSDGNWFFDLIQSGESLGDLRETLIFGPAYAGGAEALSRCSIAA